MTAVVVFTLDAVVVFFSTTAVWTGFGRSILISGRAGIGGAGVGVGWDISSEGSLAGIS
jgi:hypothetical protein